jgi:hypothetical protein
MFADLHAIAVLSTLVVPAVVIAFSHGWPPPRERRWVYAFCAITLFGTISVLIPSARGVPLTEWVFPLVATVLAAMFVKSEGAFRTVRSGLLLATVVLWCNHFFLVSDGYTSGLRFNSPPQRLLIYAGEQMRREFLLDRVFPPGPVKDLLPGFEEPWFAPRTYRRLWHTPFTRLYEVTRTPGEVWYPGGPVEKGSRELVWKAESG